MKTYWKNFEKDIQLLRDYMSETDLPDGITVAWGDLDILLFLSFTASPNFPDYEPTSCDIDDLLTEMWFEGAPEDEWDDWDQETYEGEDCLSYKAILDVRVGTANGKFFHQSLFDKDELICKLKLALLMPPRAVPSWTY
tara:strand:- start:1465 stop:1881 length:417 start_codon:yes stop_codon:yes gene_type:complete